MSDRERRFKRALFVWVWVAIFVFGVHVVRFIDDPSQLTFEWFAALPAWLLGLLIAVLVTGPVLLVQYLRIRASPPPPPPPPAESGGASDVESISEREVRSTSTGCLAGFFSVFLAAGLLFATFFVVPAVRNVRAMLTWEEVDCEVLESFVETHSGSDSTTYSVEVRYRYQWEGVDYEGDRYHFIGGASSGRDAKQETVDRLPPGEIARCWIDPDEPSESVLSLAWTWEYLFVLLPMVFIAIGGGGLVFAWASWRNERERRELERSGQVVEPPRDEVVPTVAAGPVEIEEKAGPVAKLIIMIGVALFWNGVVSVFLWALYDEWRSTGSLDSCLAIFLIPFVLVGVLLLISVPYQVLALANPRPKLRLAHSGVPIGGSTALEWSFEGASGRLRDLKIVLEGTESATYRRGTRTHTESRVFERIAVLTSTPGMLLGRGSVDLEVPADTMHTFEGSRNQVTWTLQLHGSIRRWPDVMAQYPFVVLPPQGEDES